MSRLTRRAADGGESGGFEQLKCPPTAANANR